MMDRGLFFIFCVYLIGQCYTIPVLPMGPIWAVWPTLPTVGTGLLALFALGSNVERPAATQGVLRVLLVVWLMCLMWYCWGLIAGPVIGRTKAYSYEFGLFQLARLAEFVVLFWAVSKIRFTERRLAAAAQTTGVVLFLVCFAVLATYFRLVPLTALAPQIPADPGIAGPWAVFHEYSELSLPFGWGTIGYNHGYVALHILLLWGIRLHLDRRASAINVLLSMLALMAVFLTESRAGLAGAMVFGTLVFIRRPKLIAVALPVVIVGAAVTVALSTLDATDTLTGAVDRQSTLLRFYDVGNLSNRHVIWLSKLEALSEHPLAMAVGSGFGAAADFGSEPDNAHMLLLQVWIEMGLLGLLGLGLLVAGTLRGLHRAEGWASPMYCVTIALLVTSLTQETFYPVPAFGSFTGLYLAGMAMALTRSSTSWTGEGHSGESEFQKLPEDFTTRNPVRPIGRPQRLSLERGTAGV